MRHIKESIMRFISKLYGIIVLLSVQVLIAQEEVTENVIEETVYTGTAVHDSIKKPQDTTKVFQRIKIDGVSAVIGDYVILESDIDKSYLSLETQGVSTKDITRCQLLGKLMEDKLYAHQAIQDSIIVSDAEVA